MGKIHSKAKKIKNKRTNIPYCSKNTLKLSKEAGKNVNKILEPSKGGMGTKLKIAKSIFKKIIKPKTCPRPVEINIETGIKRKNKPNTKAINKLAAGPANATLADPYF